LSFDFKASYRIHDGQVFNVLNFFDGWEFLCLDRIVGDWDSWKELLDEGEFEDIQSDSDGAIKTDYWWNPKWIPITSNGAGDNECLDLDPDESGTLGQVIIMVHDDSFRPLITNSFRAWLDKFANDLEAGVYIYSPKYDCLEKK
jgi:cell wall assembly regulator SMI1